MSSVTKLFHGLNQPVGPFDSSYELYYVALPFIEHRLPQWLFTASLYMPLFLFISRTILRKGFTTKLDSAQTTNEQADFYSKYGDLLD